MIFESVSAGGCRSYLIGCEETCAAVLPSATQPDLYIRTEHRCEQWT